MHVGSVRRQSELPLALGTVLAHRFRITERLGAGAFGEVYEAQDGEHSTRVALKVLRRTDPAALLHFKREFRALTDVIHPNLVVLYELFVDADRWFFTMERIEGSTILEHLRTHPASLRDILRQLAEGVEALHARGMIHRDLKPQNVMVSSAGRVVILDFGLVSEATSVRAARAGTYLRGAPAYIAPEQLSAARTTPACDWYAVGTLLFEALTHRLPFSGNVREMLQMKRNGECPRPSDVASGMPADLDALAADLLRRDPASRPSGSAILARLGAATVAHAGEAILVGREPELDALEHAYRASREGKPVAVLVHGGSGVGKSALVHHFLSRIERKPAAPLVIAGRCHERESVPYKAFDGLVDALHPHLVEMAEHRRDDIRSSDLAALTRLFPVLPFAKGDTGAATDERELRKRAFHALRALLSALAAERPIVAFIDDIQWGDLDSAALLLELLRGPDAPPVLWIAGCRTEEIDGCAGVSALAGATDLQKLPVAVLARGASERLASMLLQDVGETPTPGRIRTIVDESGGHPLFLGELVRAAAVHSDLTVLIRSRLALLSSLERSVLDLVSLSGAPISRELATHAASMDAQDALTRLRAARLVRASGASATDRLEPYHDRIRETVVSSMSPRTRASTHRALAVALEEAVDGTDPEAIAHHWEGCGEASRAAKHVRHAADAASTALAFDRAARLYRKSLELSSSETHSELHERLGEAVWNAGHGVEAAESFLAAAQSRTDEVEALELRRRAAESYLYCGRLEQGKAHLRACFTALGMPMHERPTTAVLAWMLESMRLRMSEKQVPPRVAKTDPMDRLRMDTCWSAAQGLGWTNPILSPAFVARGLRLARRCGDLGRQARFLANRALVEAAVSGKGRAEATRLFTEARALATRACDAYALGVVRLDEGTVALSQGEWLRCREALDEALDLFHAHGRGVVWEKVNAEFLRLGALYYLGERETFSSGLLRVLAESDERGDLHGSINLRTRSGYLVELQRGRTDDAARMIEDARQHFDDDVPGLQRVFLMTSMAEIALYQDDGAAAWKAIEAHWSRIRRSFVLRVSLMALIARDVRARAALLRARQTQGAEAQRLLSIAKTEIQELDALRETKAQPFARALEGSWLWLSGDPVGAVKTWERAEAELRAADMPMHADAALRARLGLVVRGAEEDDAIARMLVVQP